MTIAKATTKTNHYHYYRILTALVMLAMLSGLLVAPAARPAHAASKTFTVTRIDDRPDAKVGDGICSISTSGTFCTLRAAIQEANASPGADTIDFNINAGGGVATIAPDSDLPTITDRVTIDGYSQQGAHPNTKTVGDDAVIKIQLDGNDFGGRGLEILNASNCVIRGLAITRFDTGISIVGLDDSVGNRVEGNFIGTDPTGNHDQGNRLDGVFVNGPSEVVVGGSTPEKRNVISGNDDTGVDFFVTHASRIQGNYVGTDRSGTTNIGNTLRGVRIKSSSGTGVGGTTTGSRNLISGNSREGLVIEDSDGTQVLGNRIGTTAGGKSDLPNSLHGVQITSTSSNLTFDNEIGDGTAAGSNTIAFNGLDGVEINATSTGNSVSRNSIFSNAGLGIDLLGPGEDSSTNVSNTNDAGDKDSGPNNLQNSPAITSARTASGKTTIKGKLVSTPNQTFSVRFYANPNGTGEGKQSLGQKSVTAKADGSISFTFSPATTVAAGQTITATATRVSTGDTSEFSVATPRAVVTS